MATELPATLPRKISCLYSSLLYICISISISICTCGDELSVSDTTGSVWQRAPQDKQSNRGKRTFRSFLQSLRRRTTECIAAAVKIDAKNPFSTVLPLTFKTLTFAM